MCASSKCTGSCEKCWASLREGVLLHNIIEYISGTLACEVCKSAKRPTDLPLSGAFFLHLHMASAAPRPCTWHGCGRLGAGGRCAQHQVQADRQRGTSHARGYGYAWRKARAIYLRANPLCVECMKEGRVTAATDVDHKTPHRGDSDLFWDRANWQPLCHSHHSIKTATEDGGFANACAA